MTDAPKKADYLYLDARIDMTGQYGFDNNLIDVIAVWRGGEHAGIAKSLVEYADPRFFKHIGDKFVIGGSVNLIVQIIDENEAYYRVRLAPPT